MAKIELNPQQYMYDHVTVDKVIDGDTIDVVIDLGFYLQIKQRIRVVDFNAPETNTPEGKKAKVYAKNLLPKSKNIILTTSSVKAMDGFRRYLGQIFVIQEDGELALFSDLMIQNGHGTLWKQGQEVKIHEELSVYVEKGPESNA
jgi:micrococcal nuclease